MRLPVGDDRNHNHNSRETSAGSSCFRHLSYHLFRRAGAPTGVSAPRFIRPPTLIRVYHSYQSASYLSASHGMARPGPALLSQPSSPSYFLSVWHRVGTICNYLSIPTIPKLYVLLQFTSPFNIAEIPIYLFLSLEVCRCLTTRQKLG